LAAGTARYFWDGHGICGGQVFSSGTKLTPAAADFERYFLASSGESRTDDTRGIFCGLKVDIETERWSLVLDPLSQYSLFIHEADGLFVASNSVYLIEAVVKALGQNLTRSASVACYEASCAIGAGERTGFEEISLLPFGAVLEGKSGEWNIRHSRYQAVPPSLSYPELLDHCASRLTNYMSALEKAATGGALLFDLTGGLDSRVCFAAAIGAGIKSPNFFVGGNEGDDDLYVARHLARQFGAKEGNFPENCTEPAIAANEMARRAAFQQQGHSTLYHYALGKARLSNVLRVRGGGGEMLRSHQGSISSNNLFGDRPKRLLKRFFKGDPLYRQALREYWSGFSDSNLRYAARWAFKTSNYFMGQQALYTQDYRKEAIRSLTSDYQRHGRHVQSMGMDLYLKDRMRRHFSYVSRAMNFSLGAFEPLFDPYILAAAEALPWEERVSGKLIFDLIEKMAGRKMLEVPFAAKSMKPLPSAYLAARLRCAPSSLTAVDRSYMPVIEQVNIPTTGTMDQWAEFDGRETLGNHAKYLWQNRKYMSELGYALPKEHACWQFLNRENFLNAAESDAYFFHTEKMATIGLRFLHMFIWLNSEESLQGISELASVGLN